MKRAHSLAFALGAGCLAAGSAVAQGPASSPQHATVSGVVVDSLRERLLPGAVVLVEGTGRVGFSDITGRFHIDSVPPGSHRLVLMHAILDSLGIRVMTPSLPIMPGDTTWVELATPSPETLLRVKCGEGPYLQGPAGLFGLVVDSETEEPLEGASVVIAWTDLSVSREIGLRRVPRQRTATSGADGTFRICGVPSDLVADMFAWHGSDTTGFVPVAMDHPLFAIVPLAVPRGGGELYVRDTSAATAADPTAGTAPPIRRGASVLRGRVTTVSGTPVASARVSVHGADGVVLTDAAGRVTLTSQPSGSQTAIVRKLGYQPVEFAVILSSNRPREVDVQLADFVPILETVRVEARRSVLDAVGFTARQRTGSGTFLTPDDLERRSVLRLSDYFASVPAVRLRNLGGTDRTVTGRSGCVRWFVDDAPWIGEGTPEEYIHPHEVGAIEVYSANFTPGRYTRAGGACETIVLWTRAKLGDR